ncbi:DUF4439 domain-containing protein [Arthrobacter sp. JZ12]|uniref:DUF4439 domain-containing protein n=1 Tax=Arthrobacter sp. JZ12 TaxID=2654190 RepID=UPI002B4A7D92|nr:DUF4439 domain-containing protein [Arthrobacter sp. JZ12]WRH24601.1 DUF4439 domain-containing protein [Arthrobacter sp. JZ12]
MTHSRNRTARGGSGFGRGVRRFFRFIVLLLVLVMVACIGLVIGTEPREEPTPTELALADSAGAARSLASTARALAGEATAADSPPYESMATIFDLHAAALQLPDDATEPPPSAFSDTGNDARESPSTSPSAAPAVQPRDLLIDLALSYTKAFNAAATAEPGPARVLASVATAQWLQARSLAGSMGVSLPSIPVPDAQYDGAPACPVDVPLQRDTGLEGARLAVLAEHRAAYAYELAAARAPEPQEYLPRMAEHDDAASSGSAVLAQQCVAEPLPAVAYSLTGDFLADTGRSLQLLEGAMVETYADLVGVSRTGIVRTWAIRRLADTAQHAIETGAGQSPATGLPAFPGIAADEYPRLEEPGR